MPHVLLTQIIRGTFSELCQFNKEIISTSLHLEKVHTFVLRYKKKKKNLFLFDHFVNTIHTYTLSMSYIYNLNNTNMKILANMVIMRINNNKSRVRRLL